MVDGGGFGGAAWVLELALVVVSVEDVLAEAFGPLVLRISHAARVRLPVRRCRR